MLAVSGAAALAPLGYSALAQTTAGTQAQAQRAALSGRYRGLAWSVYGPGQLQGLTNTANNLRVSAHPQARVLGAKWDGRNIVLAFRVNAPLQTVYNYHASSSPSRASAARATPRTSAATRATLTSSSRAATTRSSSS
jgi:hypothetical protein